MEQSQQIAEMAVIGGMMIDSSALYKVTGQLNSNDFEDERNQLYSMLLSFFFKKA